MDFSKQLANLQRTARSASAGVAGAGAGTAAASSSSARKNDERRNSDGGVGRGDHSSERSGGGKKRGRDEYEHSSSSSSHQRDRRRGDDRGWEGRPGRHRYHNSKRDKNNHGGGGRREDWRGGVGGGRHRGSDGSNFGRGRDREEALTTLVQSILTNPYENRADSSTQLAASSVAADVQKKRHLALLFLTIDDLPFEHIWKAWLGGAGCANSPASEILGQAAGMTVSILCHAKYPDRVKSPWLKERLLIDKRSNIGDNLVRYHTRRPEWGSVEITRAMIDLVEEGLQIGGSSTSTDTCRFISTSTANSVGDSEPFIPPVDRFIFVSESCLPIATIEEVESALYGKQNGQDTTSPKSWIKARNTPNNGYARQQQWERMSRAIPVDNIWKADQWILLIREHAEAVVRACRVASIRGELWECFRRTRASDELYFPTVLSLLGIITASKPKQDSGVDTADSSIGVNVLNRRITYCDWSMSAKNPASFNVLAKGRKAEYNGAVRKARDEGCLFARKFVAGEAGPGRPSTSASESVEFDTNSWLDTILHCGEFESRS
mmetsp:Transcript_6535/g.13754  ORF Transcript_6535/g.13754 Transcript_6535/m.13754 type:complete len:551 (+) Transcript_6535:183-1835(+)